MDGGGGAGAAPSPAQLPAADSELAQQLTRDPYVLDVLDSTGTAEERNLKAALVDRLQIALPDRQVRAPRPALTAVRRDGRPSSVW